MKGAFRAASRRQKSKSSPILIGVNAKERNSNQQEATRNLSTTRRIKAWNAGPLAYPPGKSSKNLRVQQPAELDPRNARIRPSMYGDRTPGGQGHRTRHPRRGPRTSQKPELRGIRDFMGFRTMRDPGLRGIQDFTRPRTSWDLGLRRKQEFYTPGPGFCSVVFSLRTQTFRIKLKTWTPLGIRLVVSAKYCVLFLWLLGARTLPTELYGAK